jgi:O-antigen/teichoic acid export membrane protein
MQKTFLKDFISYLPSKLIPAIIPFVTTPILTHLLLPAEYGYWALATGVTDFLFQSTCSGIGAAVKRFFATYQKEHRLSFFYSTLGISLGMAIIPTTIIGLTATLLIRSHINPTLYPLILISVFTFIFQAIFFTAQNVLIAQERGKVYTIFELLNRYGGLGLGILLVITTNLQVEGLMWGTLIMLVLTIPFIYVSTSKGMDIVHHLIHFPDVSQLWQYALPLCIGNMANWGLRLSDRFVLSLYRPESEVGLYSAAYHLSYRSVDILAGLFGLSMLPILVYVWESKGRKAAEDTIKMFTRLYIIICLPVATGLTILASPFVFIFASKAYHDGYLIVGYVAFSSFVFQLSQIASFGILLRKKTRSIATNQIVAALVNLGLNFILIPRYGFVAAGITTLVGYLMLFALQINSSRPYLTWRFPWRSLRNSIIANVIMSIVTLGIYRISGSLFNLNIGFLFSSIIVAVPVYFSILWLLGEANDEEHKMVSHLLRRMFGKSI